MKKWQPLFDYVQRFIPINEIERAYVISNLREEHYKKGEIILNQGEVMKDAFFILKGCVRMYITVEGKEHTTSFFEEDKFAMSWTSFLTQLPSQQAIQCLEDCEIVLFSHQFNESAMDSFEKFYKLSSLRLREEVIRLEQSYVSLLIQSSTDRYLDFVDKYPGLVQRISQNQLASCLGMRPETLSRIRKKLSAPD